MILLTLLYMSYLDIKYYEISNTSQLTLLFICLFKAYGHIHILFTIGFFIMFLLIYKFRDKQIGGADIKVLTILSLYYAWDIYYILFIASLSALLFAISFKVNKVAFIPFIALGGLIVQI